MAHWMRTVRQRSLLFLALVRHGRSTLQRPVVADLFVTTRCNGQCAYCYTDKTISRREELDTGQWKAVIDGLYDRGCRMFNLMGGEPLLREDFGELLEHILAKDVLCDVNTNGFLVPERLDVLGRASQIFTSLDGDAAAHDANRGPGSFARTVAGILAARRAGVPVRVNCTVTRHSAHAADFLVEFAERHNLFLTFTPLIRVREALAERAASLYMDDTEAKAAFRRIKAAKRRTSRIMNSDSALDFFINYPVPLGRIVRRDETGPHVDYYTTPCPYGRNQFFVVSNGDVFPCHNLWNDPGFVPGNVLRDGLDQALRRAGELWCKYCWLANLVEWNQFSSPGWLLKGAAMTVRQIMAPREKRAGR